MPKKNTCHILHADMDAFFAMLEVRKNPKLAGLPVIVCGTGKRGVVSTASYEARVFGVHSAMPTAVARRQCPDGIFIPGDHAHYSAVSKRIMKIFERFTPLVEPLSLDEAFLDVGGSERLWGKPVQVAAKIQKAVYESEGLRCSIGIAVNKYLSKMASREAKPRISAQKIILGTGIKVIEPGREMDFLTKLPIGSLWGVGPSTHKKLKEHGIKTVGDIAQVPRDSLEKILGKALGRHLKNLSTGHDDRSVSTAGMPKSMSAEQTFPEDIHSRDDLHSYLVEMSDRVATRLRAAGATGRTLVLKLRYGADFRTISKSFTFDHPVDSGVLMAKAAKSLLKEEDVAPGIRLIGVGMKSLSFASDFQHSLLGTPDENWRKVEKAMDAIRFKFDKSSIIAGSTMKKGDTPQSTPWGPLEG